ncbi:DUF4062 domain-containing protein [Phaeobacter inhibens]|uniref:DUF4062 domain-containing protein n=1 Tax=Phaeobacter inhibens TaxID=221822 RepID=UPI00076BB0E3|nr:DUF4062 domain-containing protein [Phaeobacter inhibens]KXF91306.1 hypothetical protein AT574_07570 [Phaeobacter inhibens]WHP69391.1 DUF4062 domain-containing protein [Phaeobacter inhibens]
MAAPSVFVSSTFVDLQHLREHLEKFITNFGYTPIMFEFGGIGFDYDKPIDESCYDEVAQSDMFVLVIGGRYGSPATDSVKGKSKSYMSITRKEYESAIASGKPVFTFVESSVLNERRTYNKNKGNKSIVYASVDDTQIFDFIDDIYSKKKNNFVKPFGSLDDITTELRNQWAGIVKRAVNAKQALDSGERIRINSFKLFFYRHRRGMSQRQLERELDIPTNEIRKLERVRYHRKFDGYNDSYFPLCDRSILRGLEEILQVEGKLAAGQHDDFTAMFMEFYGDNRGKKAGATLPRSSPLLSFETRAVVFDFDGTITFPTNGRTTWEMIWEHLGYDINECAEYHSQFRRNIISHEEWCAITLEKFQSRGFKDEDIESIVSGLNIVDGFSDVVNELSERNIRLDILSGSIRQIIRKSIGDSALEFEQIKANEMHFDPVSGVISNIVGTTYDFEGKAKYMRQLVTELGCSPMDVLFVGNAGNDSWVSQSGVRTLCVNPTSTDADNPKMWWQSIREMKDMREILPYCS